MHGAGCGRGVGRRPALAALAALVGVLGPAATAQGAIVSFGAADKASTVRFFAAPGEVNAVTAHGDATGVTLTDAGGTPPTPGAGCVRQPADPTTIRCTGAVTQLEISVGDLDDVVDNATSVPSALSGGDGYDRLTGGDGSDRITTRGLFTDQVACRGGDDFVTADQTDQIAADCEHVDVPGVPAGGQTGAGAPPPAVVVPLLQAGGCVTKVQGTDAADQLKGTAGGDLMLGLNGNDRIRGLAGADCLFGGNDDDAIAGGPGDDFVGGEAGFDHVAGGDGADRVAGGVADDRVSGGPGDDTAAGGAGADRMKGGAGSDRMNGGGGSDTVAGGAGADYLLGGAGNDRIAAGSGRNRVAGGGGADRISARNGEVDRLACGGGRDVVVTADRKDHVAGDCETVRRR